MAAGVTIKVKRKTSAFTGGQLAAGELGLDTTNSVIYASTNGSTVFSIGNAVTSGNLSQFSSTTSAELASIISNETGTGSLVFATSPTLVTPILGTPTSGTLTNCTGLPLSGLAQGSASTGQIPYWNGSTWVATDKDFMIGTTSLVSSTFGDRLSIPSWVQKMTIVLYGANTTGTSPIILQIGDSGGVETTNYFGATSEIKGSPDVNNYTTGYIISPSPAASDSICAVINLIKIPSENTWIFSVSGGNTVNNTAFSGGGTKSTSATLDRVRITTAGGVDTFNSGAFLTFYQ